MQLTSLDWIVVAACLFVSFAPSLFFARRAGKGTAEFFASGRSAPWWLIGTSMVATTFSTDTPNLVTDFVRSDGVARNWVWWAFLITGMMTVFFYSRLWRRSGVLTDLEFYEVRYSGKPAAFVRGFRAVYLGLLFNCMIMATVTLAAAKIANVMLGWSRLETVLVCGTLCLVFSMLSGLWGVLVADVIQFVIAMVGVFIAASCALGHPEVGGFSGLLEKIDPKTLSLLPDFGDWELTLTIFVIPLTVQWWAAWYPGAEPGGGSYIAQRMLAAKDERHAMVATLWFNVAHYALRPWPWIIVALCSIVVFPTLDDIQTALPHVSEDLIGNDLAYPAMLTLLPSGLLGLLVASLLSAYISTMSTHLNWGSSYLVHDLYRRFFRSDRSERHYVAVSRWVVAGLTVLSCALMFALESAGEGFTLLLSIGAGTGSIYLLRWFWSRVNAQGEIAAMLCSFFMAAGVFVLKKFGVEISPARSILIPVAVTTAVWVLVVLVTPKVSQETLVRFYRLVRPGGPGWASIRKISGVDAPPDSIAQGLIGWTLGCLLVYSVLFGTGNFLYGHHGLAAVCGAVFLVSGVGLFFLLRSAWRRGPELPPPTPLATGESTLQS